jgi:hypothetical protein
VYRRACMEPTERFAEIVARPDAVVTLDEAAAC